MALFINGVGQDTFSMNGVSIDNLYVDGVLVWQKETGETESTIQYKLIEDLVDGGLGVLRVFNSGVGSFTYDGGLEYTGDGTEAEGNPFDPGALYTKNGTIDLTAQADGKGSTQINTQLDILEARLTQVAYDIVPGVSYKMYCLEEHGLGSLDIYMGDSVNGYPDTPTYEITDYSPEVGTLKITSELPDVIPVGETSEWHYISIYQNYAATLPPGITVINPVTPVDQTDQPVLDKDGLDLGWTMQILVDNFNGRADGYLGTNDNTGWMTDVQMGYTAALQDEIDSSMIIKGLDQAGKYHIRISGGRDLDSPRELQITIGGVTDSYNSAANYGDGDTVDAPNGIAEFIDVVPDSSGHITMLYKKISGTTAYLSAIDIKRTS